MYFFLSLFATLVSKLSDRGLHCFASSLAFLAYRVFGMRRKLIAKNLKIAFGDQATPEFIDKIGFESFYSLILTALEFIESYKRDLASTVEIIGIEHMHNALEANQGAYIICMHMANWEALAAAVCRNIRPSYVPVKVVGGEGVNNFVTHLRNKYGLHTAKRMKKGDSFEIIKQTLKQKDIVGFMVDQARPGSPKLPFFGVPARTNTSLAGIWQKATAPIVPIMPRRIAPRQHTIEFFPALSPPNTGNLESDVLTHTQMFTAVTEDIIRRNPGQYLWLHNRWKN